MQQLRLVVNGIKTRSPSKNKYSFVSSFNLLSLSRIPVIPDTTGRRKPSELACERNALEKLPDGGQECVLRHGPRELGAFLVQQLWLNLRREEIQLTVHHRIRREPQPRRAYADDRVARRIDENVRPFRPGLEPENVIPNNGRIESSLSRKLKQTGDKARPRD